MDSLALLGRLFLHVGHVLKPAAARVCLLGGGDFAGWCHFTPCNKSLCLAKRSAFVCERNELLLEAALCVTAAGLDGKLLLALFDAITIVPV